jgi:chromosome segregation ATPase
MNAERTATAVAFQTPPRILIPKLVRSRDAWKDKATRRKAQNKALQIRVRDLTASRLRHRQRADRLSQQLEQLRLQLDHTQQQLAQVRAEREALQARLVSPSSPLPGTAAALPVPKKTTR